MGWFRRHRPPAFVVAVLDHTTGRASGAAALLTRRRVLTCAHVVNDALGRDLLNEARPTGASVEVAFHGTRKAARRRARVELWVPPQQHASTPLWSGDLAVLELAEDAPAQHEPVVWHDMTEGRPVRAWHGGGEAIAFADSEVKLHDGSFGYLDAPLSGAAIGPGFSGGPLWCLDDHVAVGLVVAQVLPGGEPLSGQQTVRRGWAVPWQTVRAELIRAGADRVVGDCRSGQTAGDSRDPLHADLADCLRRLLHDPIQRADHAVALAAELGWQTSADGTAPSVRELVSVLVSEDRALPALTESLAPAAREGTLRAAFDRLRALAPVTGSGLLLSPGEHRLLLDLLRPATDRDPFLLPRAAAEALRHLPLPNALCGARLKPTALDGVVRELELYRDSAPVPEGSAPVPALLRLVEFTAAALPGTAGDALRSWSDQVAARLGIEPAALGQRRADAALWAGQRAERASHLVARLSADGPRGLFRCEIWHVRSGTYVRWIGCDNGYRTGDEAARLIREAAESSPGDDGGPVTDVHVAVDRGGLQLPVDEWDAGSSVEFVPGLPLGARFRVSLRCPEMSRRVPTRDSELRRRWERGGGPPLVLDESSADPLRAGQLLQTSHRDTRQVVLHGPRAVRAKLIDLCLALGVPVLLWDRVADGHADAPVLDGVTPAGPLLDLPRRLHEYRGKACGSPGSYPARPSLVWEDTALPLPGGLEFKDPPEGPEGTETR
ncbi:trypsin-like peptidase domain-containing protein [Streptomyces xinghaiensis]|uniref:VMAP-C domain-containing protein n=1 Tax=Streptomyces xinghaiensis TaxID=1038928 RepID=UPI0037AF71C6